MSQGNVPHALTGIEDENGERYGSYTYDGAGLAIGAKNGTDANVYTLNIGSASTIVTDPLGVKRTYSFKNVQGVARTTALSQACDYCGGANVKAQSIDANGNPASRTDWNGNRTDYAYDLTRNLETQRVEGLTSAGIATTATRAPSARSGTRACDCRPGSLRLSASAPTPTMHKAISRRRAFRPLPTPAAGPASAHAHRQRELGPTPTSTPARSRA